jgi:hypothetical protein
LRFATLVTTVVTGCARANGELIEEPAPDAAGIDARPIDAAPDAAAEPDAPIPDAGCAISAGLSPVIDGVADLDDYPSAQRLTPGAMLGADSIAIAWDASKLYITASSLAFESEYEPLHVYVESATALTAAAPAPGKEYSGLVPMLPFAPTHLIGARRTNGVDLYDGVYLPAATWTTRGDSLAPGTNVFASADHRTLSVVVPWTALGGCPTALRLAVHVVHAVSANEWKVLVPSTHTPWLAPGGGYYEVDLTAPPAVAGWTLH